MNENLPDSVIGQLEYTCCIAHIYEHLCQLTNDECSIVSADGRYVLHKCKSNTVDFSTMQSLLGDAPYGLVKVRDTATRFVEEFMNLKTLDKYLVSNKISFDKNTPIRSHSGNDGAQLTSELLSTKSLHSSENYEKIVTLETTITVGKDEPTMYTIMTYDTIHACEHSLSKHIQTISANLVSRGLIRAGVQMLKGPTPNKHPSSEFLDYNTSFNALVIEMRHVLNIKLGCIDSSNYTGYCIVLLGDGEHYLEIEHYDSSVSGLGLHLNSLNSLKLVKTTDRVEEMCNFCFINKISLPEKYIFYFQKVGEGDNVIKRNILLLNTEIPEYTKSETFNLLIKRLRAADVKDRNKVNPFANLERLENQISSYFTDGTRVAALITEQYYHTSDEIQDVYFVLPDLKEVLPGDEMHDTLMQQLLTLIS